MTLYTREMDRLWTPWRYNYITQADDAGARQGVPPELAAWPGDLHCVFCNLIESVEYAIEQGMNPNVADRAAGVLVRDRYCFVCLNAYPYSSGHMMVVPYQHTGSLGDLRPEVASEMMEMAQRAAHALQATYSPQGMNFGMNIGKAAGAGVADHLHMHALPRWVGDTNFMTAVGETRILPEILDDTWAKLRATFARI